jgi:hypothetical protein
VCEREKGKQPKHQHILPLNRSIILSGWLQQRRGVPEKRFGKAAKAFPPIIAEQRNNVPLKNRSPAQPSSSISNNHQFRTTVTAFDVFKRYRTILSESQETEIAYSTTNHSFHNDARGGV